MPGPGAKGVGDVAMRNYDAWKEIRINMDTICENVTPDTSIELFGEKFAYPFFAGPVGAMKLHYGEKYDSSNQCARKAYHPHNIEIGRWDLCITC